MAKQMFNRGREKEKNISQYPQKLWHFSFYGGEGIEGVGEYPNKQNAEHFSEKGTLFLCLLRYFSPLPNYKGRERNGTEYER
ncbi:MAG: hypothetical protein ACLTL2_03805 [Blautia sp.]|nr:hypothetical protein [uncultured Blautia sp.]